MLLCTIIEVESSESSRLFGLDNRERFFGLEGRGPLVLNVVLS